MLIAARILIRHQENMWDQQRGGWKGSPVQPSQSSSLSNGL